MGSHTIRLSRWWVSVRTGLIHLVLPPEGAQASPEVALERYKRGVKAGARAIGPERFAALAGEFWRHLDLARACEEFDV